MTLTLHIPEGTDLLVALTKAAQAAGITHGLARLSGILDSTKLIAAPGGSAVSLKGPLYLVNAELRLHPGAAALLGTVSWSDQGLPRLAAGRLEGAQSGGIDVIVTRLDPEVAIPPAKKRAPRAQAPEPSETPKTRRTAPKSDHIDLTEEVAAITPNLAATPAPAAPPKESTGWGAVVAASSAKKTRGRNPRRSGAPSPDELGFDAPPKLNAGDIVLHPRFGRCKVSRGTVAGKVKVRRPTGGLLDLSVKHFQFTREPDDDGRRVFRVQVSRR